MHMRPRRPARRAHRTELLPLRHTVADLHIEALAVQKSAGQPHAVIDDQQIALQREGRISREHDDPVGGREKGRACGHGDISAAVIAARLALIDAL